MYWVQIGLYLYVLSMNSDIYVMKSLVLEIAPVLYCQRSVTGCVGQMYGGTQALEYCPIPQTKYMLVNWYIMIPVCTEYVLCTDWYVQ
jgi:hypothetical protein